MRDFEDTDITEAL